VASGSNRDLCQGTRQDNTSRCNVGREGRSSIVGISGCAARGRAGHVSLLVSDHGTYPYVDQFVASIGGLDCRFGASPPDLVMHRSRFLRPSATQRAGCDQVSGLSLHARRRRPCPFPTGARRGHADTLTRVGHEYPARSEKKEEAGDVAVRLKNCNGECEAFVERETEESMRRKIENAVKNSSEASKTKSTTLAWTRDQSRRARRSAE